MRSPTTSTQTYLIATWTQQNINPHTKHKSQDGPQPKNKISSLMLSNIQVHRQVPLNNASITEETKLALLEVTQQIWLQNLLKQQWHRSDGLNQTAHHHKPDSTPVAVRLYPLVLKHQDFLKQKIKIYWKQELLTRACPHGQALSYLSKIHPKGSPQQFRLCMNYRTLNSLLPSITPATGTKKGNFALMPLPKIDYLSAILKGAR